MSTKPCCAPIVGSLNHASAEDLAVRLKALADPIRIRLLSMIAAAPDGEMCACDFPAIFDRSQPTMSHHLSVLTEAKLIERQQRGKWAWFRIDRDHLADVCNELSALCEPRRRSSEPLPEAVAR